MWQTVLISLFCVLLCIDRAPAQSVRGAFPSPSIQILPMMVASERGFYKREGLDLELVFVRGASTAVQALLANQIHFIFSVGPQMPAVWEGNDIMLLATSRTSDFFSRGNAGYPEDRGSQRKENRRDLWRFDGSRYEGIIGSQQAQSG